MINKTKMANIIDLTKFLLFFLMNFQLSFLHDFKVKLIKYKVYLSLIKISEPTRHY